MFLLSQSMCALLCIFIEMPTKYKFIIDKNSQKIKKNLFFQPLLHFRYKREK